MISYITWGWFERITWYGAWAVIFLFPVVRWLWVTSKEKDEDE